MIPQDLPLAVCSHCPEVQLGETLLILTMTPKRRKIHGKRSICEQT